MEKKSKKSILIGVTSLLLVMLLLVGLTYAYYRTRIIGNESTDPSISVQSKKMEIVYEDGTSEMNMTGKIEPGFEASKTFYVKNTGSETVKYSVILDDMVNEYQRNQDWQVTLTKNGTSVISADDNVYLAVGTHQVLLGSETIAAPTNGGESKDTYVLTVTYKNLTDIDQSEDMGMNLSFKVNIAEEQYTWSDAPAGSLLYALKNNQPTGTGETEPGKAVSLDTEARILSTEDDYGTSYVYRGAVTNNYVTYSNMCWRIVRVQGDGTIKLALADWEHPCGTANGFSATNNDSAFVTDTNGKLIRNSYFVSSYEYKGLEDALIENSIIPNDLQTWADNHNLDTSNLVETDYCIDISISKIDNDYAYCDEDGECVKVESVEEANDGQAVYRFGSKDITLKCNMKGLNASKSTRYNNKLGLLTVNELIHAGYNNWAGNENVYLSQNSNNGFNIWLFSPSASYDEPANDFRYYLETYVLEGSQGITGNGFTDIDSNVFRPIVVLKNNVLLDATINGQTGEIDTPYVIG